MGGCKSDDLLFFNWHNTKNLSAKNIILQLI